MTDASESDSETSSSSDSDSSSGESDDSSSSESSSNASSSSSDDISSSDSSASLSSCVDAEVQKKSFHPKEAVSKMPPTRSIDAQDAQREADRRQSSRIGFRHEARQRSPDGNYGERRPMEDRRYQRRTMVEDRRYREPDVHPQRAHLIRHRQHSPENLRAMPRGTRNRSRSRTPDRRRSYREVKHRRPFIEMDRSEDDVRRFRKTDGRHDTPSEASSSFSARRFGKKRRRHDTSSPSSIDQKRPSRKQR